MAQMCGSPKTMTAAEDLAMYRRVKLSSGSGENVEYADEGDNFLGVTQANVESGSPVAVADKKQAGTQIMIASGAVALGALVYGADDGKVSTTVSGMPIGTCVGIVAAAADGDQIEVWLDGDLGETWS
jgi:hypothetical protein